jgi:hypothetical protein
MEVHTNFFPNFHQKQPSTKNKLLLAPSCSYMCDRKRERERERDNSACVPFWQCATGLVYVAQRSHRWESASKGTQ